MIVGVLLFFVPLQCHDSTYFDFANLAQEVYIQSICGFLVLIWLIDCFIARKIEIKKCNLYWPILGILIWSLVSLSWTTNKPESLEVIFQWLACSIIFFVIFNLVKNSFDISIIIGSIFLSLAYLVIIGYIQFFDETFTYYHQIISPSGTFGNKNMFSDYLVITLPLCFVFFAFGSDKKSFWLRILSGVIFISGVILIFLTKTRAGMLASPLLFIFLILGMIYLFRIHSPAFFKDAISKQKIMFFGIFTVLCPLSLVILMFTLKKEGFTPEDFKKRLNSIVSFPEKDKLALNKNLKDEELSPVSDSTTIRWIVWTNTLIMIKDKPVNGFGLNNWQIHYADYRRAYYNDPSYQPGLILAQVHNDYLQIIVEIGFIGFFLFIWLIFGLFHQFKKVFFSKEESIETKFQILPLIICLIGFGLSCFFSFLLIKATPSLLFFIYAALIANLYFYSTSNLSKNLNNSYVLNRSVAGMLLLPVLIVTYWVANLEAKRSEADILYKTANDNLANQKYETACQIGEEILKIAPQTKKTYLLLGNAYLSMGQYEKAIENMEVGLKYYPNDLMALYQMGTIYLSQIKELKNPTQMQFETIKNLEDKTIFWYSKALAIRNDFSKALNNLGYLYERRSYRWKAQGNSQDAAMALNEAEICFDKAILSNGNYSEAILNKVNVLLERKKYDEASRLALSVLKNSFAIFQEADNKFQDLIKANIQKNTSKYIDAFIKRSTACQEYLYAGAKAVALLRVIYYRNNEFEKLLSILEYERNILIQKAENQRVSYASALDEYNSALENPENIRKGMSIEQYKNFVDIEMQKKDIQEKESIVKMAALLIDNADISRVLGNHADSLKALQKVIDLSKSHNILEQETLARLKMNEVYISSLEANLPVPFSTIEENFEKATFSGNKQVLEAKNQLMLKYQQLKEKHQPK